MLAKNEYLSRAESYKLKELIERSNKINDYDYNNMIKNFRMGDKQRVLKYKQIQKIKTHNKKWKGEVLKIKQDNKHHMIQFQKELENKYKIKDNKLQDFKTRVHNQIQTNLGILKADTTKTKHALNSVEYSKELDEDDRLYTQSYVQDKSN